MPSSSHSRDPTPHPSDALLLPDGPVSEQEAELLHEFVHPHHHQHQEETLVDPLSQDDDDVDFKLMQSLPWWKRPSPRWLLAMLPISSIAMSATIAPKVEIYTALACAQHKPEIFDNINYAPVIPSVPSKSAVTSFSGDTSTVISIPKGEIPGEIDAPTRKPSNPCASDPVVLAAVAKLAAVMSACMGILGCLTTGWWSSFSDRHGRVRTMGICIVGLLLTDTNFIFVYHFSQRLPGGYWLLLAGPLIEGSLGGLPTAVASGHAYMADSTSASTRSRVFSMSLGLLFSGVALGPTLGGILIRFTQQTISVFYAATLTHLVYAFMVWFLIPESLSKRKMQMSKDKYNEQLLDTQRARELNRDLGFLMHIKRLFTFLSPLSIFMPESVAAVGDPLKGVRQDWNLTFVALSYAFTISILGSVTYKFQYAASAFGWTSETLGYWLSLVGATRALHLAVILPLCIKLFKAKPRELNEATESLSGVDALPGSASPPTSGARERARSHSHSPSRLTEPHSSAFDLGLARVSLLVELIAYTAMGFATHPLMFTLFGMFGSLGSGFSPAIQSVALELYTKRGGTESGRLFGAISVIQALSSQIIGPAMYGLIYINTVATLPRTIFFVSVGTVAVSFVFVSLVRLPDRQGTKRTSDHEDSPTEPLLAWDATLVDEDEEEVQDRRRKPTRAVVGEV